MITKLLLLVVLGNGSFQHVNYVDKLEVNHRIDASGKKSLYVQVVAWKWSEDYKRYDAVTYCIDKGLPHQMAGGWYELRIPNVVIRAPICEHTFTTHDPEQTSHRRFGDVSDDPVLLLLLGDGSMRQVVYPVIYCKR